MQKNGAGLHTASSCFWDSSTDGRFSLPGKGCPRHIAGGPCCHLDCAEPCFQEMCVGCSMALNAYWLELPFKTLYRRGRADLWWLQSWVLSVWPDPESSEALTLPGVQCDPPPSPRRELHRAMGEQDHVLHRQRLRTVHLKAPPCPWPFSFHPVPSLPSSNHQPSIHRSPFSSWVCFCGTLNV